MKEEQHTDLEILIAKRVSGNISTEEAALLEKLLLETDSGNDLLEDYQKLYQNSKIVTPEGIDVNVEWDAFIKNTKKVKRSKQPSRNWLAIAASVVLLLGVVYTISYLTSDHLIEYNTTSEIQEITLPDGSVVTVNKNSSLSYDNSFGETRRTLSIEGEAFFDVKRDEQKPFIVRAENTQVEVLGTSFNVDAAHDIIVTVTTGTVQFSSTSDQKVILTPGEIGFYNQANQSIKERHNKDLNYLAWKTKRFTYSSSPLSDVIADLIEVYDADIEVEADVSSCVISVTFDNQSLESILNILEEVANLSYLKEDNIIRITSAGC